MSLLFIDSSDHYNTAAIADKYTSTFGSPSVTTGRNGNGLRGRVRMGLNPGDGTCIAGMAINYDSLSVGTVFSMGDINTDFLELDRVSDGRLRLQADTTLYSPANTIFNDQWHYIEWAIEVTAVEGIPGVTVVVTFVSAQVWVDGALVIDASGGELGDTTISSAGASTYGWSFIDRQDTSGASVSDDFYVCDGSGSAPWNARLGDVQIGVVRPNGAGDDTEWTPSTGANYENVDDTNPDDDSTYNSAASDPLDDLFEMENINTGDTIFGAQLLVNARRTEEGAADLTPLVKQDATVYTLEEQALPSSYAYRNRDILMEAPDGAPWTDAIFNALQAGYRRSG